MYKRKPKSIEEMYDQKQQRIEKRCDLKDKSIAYFNSVNAAINLFGSFTEIDKSHLNKKNVAEVIKEWRNWFYEEWGKWYDKETTIKPVSFEAAMKANEEFAQKMNSMDWHDNPKEPKTAQIDELNADLQAEAEGRKQNIPIVEDTGEDNEPEMRAERSAMERQTNHIDEWDGQEKDIKENYEKTNRK